MPKKPAMFALMMLALLGVASTLTACEDWGHNRRHGDGDRRGGDHRDGGHRDNDGRRY